MKFNILKLKKNNLPPLESLRPPIFDVGFSWIVALGLCLAVFLITALVGLNLFYFLYFEDYKKARPAENSENIINVDKLRSVVEKRNEFINMEIILPKDPSI